MRHFCAGSQRELEGGERWEFRVDDAGATLVELRSWRHNRGVGEWIDSLIGGGARSDTTLSLKKRVAYVQFEAERRSRGGA